MRDLKTVQAWLARNKGSWSAIAEKAGISRPTLYKIANQAEPNVSIKTLIKLLKLKREGEWR